jgi:biopolymer transport protein ExbD
VPKVQATSSGGSGRLGRGRRVSTTLSEINVVPLVDIMLVLLIIFMIAAPMLQRGVDVKLPVTRRSNTIEGNRIYVTVPLSYRTERKVYVGDDQINSAALTERIRSLIATRTDKQVFLRGDGGVQYSELMEVFSQLKDAGVTDVGLVTVPPKR